MPGPKFIDEDTGAYCHALNIATPASPGATYTQAEVVAIRDALASVLTALRDAGIIAQD